MQILHRFRKFPIASPAVFSQLYERTRLPVFRYIYGLTGGPQDDVENLTAETFISAWKARQFFDGDADAAVGWLIRIAKRLVIDDYHRRMVRMTHSLPADPSPESNTIEAEQRRILHALLAEMPDEQREILTLRYMLGWRIGDIVNYLGITENNISVILHSTLAKLHKQWLE